MMIEMSRFFEYNFLIGKARNSWKNKGEIIMRKAAVNVAVIIMCLFIFAGCVRPNSLEEAISPAKLQRISDSLASGSIYKDVKVEIKGNHVTFKYYFSTYLDNSQASRLKQALQSSSLQDQIDGMKDEFEKDYGIRPTRITFIYYNSDEQMIVKIEK